MTLKLSALALATALTALAGALAPSAAKADEAACRLLETPGLFADTKVTSALMVAADAAQGTQTYCEVKATISPTPKSKIGVVLRLPESWNGKMLGLGGGGWAGNVTLTAATPGLKKGYAIAQTNGGHDNLTAFDTSWAKDNPEAQVDFSYRAVHLTAVIGKAVIARYYARAQTAAYFQGCSTGGRMGLMEAQRFPTDYNAVIAGAPVYSLVVQTSSTVRGRLFTSPATALPPATLAKVNAAALAACDDKDGLKDGILTDPRACAWNPAELECKAAASADCLTTAQVVALRKAYTTLRANGRIAVPGLSRGGELGWSTFIGTQTAPPAGAPGGGGGDPRPFWAAGYDMSGFDPAADTDKIRSTAFAKDYEAADPDIRAFLKAGGKLLLWHGFDDPAPSALSTIEYYDRVKATTGADSAVRLFVAPGLYHCGGGPGANQIDWLSALEAWDAQGVAPTSIPAARANSPMTRPVCAWPALPYFKGEGDPNDARNFECRRTTTALNQASAG